MYGDGKPLILVFSKKAKVNLAIMSYMPTGVNCVRDLCYPVFIHLKELHGQNERENLYELSFGKRFCEFYLYQCNPTVFRPVYFFKFSQ